MPNLASPILAVVLSAGLLLSGCGPGAPAITPSDTPTPVEEPTRTPDSGSDPTGQAPEPTLEPLLSPAAAAATSRGPNLEASDPEGVRLDSGGLQLVEFFRFT